MPAVHCPWYVSAAAVRRYQQLVPAAPRNFDDASDELIEECAEIWARYQRNPDLKPAITKTGAYTYRGGEPLRLRVVVSMARREEGAKPQVVDVVGAESESDEARRRKNARKRNSPSAQRARAAWLAKKGLPPDGER
jgi:hypothetical protein